MKACNQMAKTRKWTAACRSGAEAQGPESCAGRVAERGRVYRAGRAGTSTSGGKIESARESRNNVADARIGAKPSCGALGAAASRTARDRVCARRSRSQPAAIVCRGRLWPRGENPTGFLRQRKMVYVRRKNEKSHYPQGAIHRRSQNRRMAQESVGNVVLPELHHPRRGYSWQSVGAHQAGEPWVHPHPDVCREGIL